MSIPELIELLKKYADRWPACTAEAEIHIARTDEDTSELIITVKEKETVKQ